jgi:hypothetical protein
MFILYLMCYFIFATSLFNVLVDVLLMLAFKPKALDVAVVQGKVHKQQPTIERVVHKQLPKKYVGFNF